ncbi:c-type cytochrome [Pelagibacterium lentulum]|uniref:Cytochrome c n=1 Tax=Pelagibacterium lentulum TaxID=2029865 RepID=A0A916VWY3_9HYPH|nr:cytochrome c [Pelagibacterium lentulum]GGA46340.1 cytochrome c [Pelagibacterium lentulum]
MKRFLIAAAAVAAITPFAVTQESAEREIVEYDEFFASSSVLTQQTGAGIYGAVCAACHMSNGEGAVGAGAYPALAENPNLEFPEYAIYLTIHGQAAMPPLGGILSDEQIAAVIEYIRTSFGNDYPDPVTAEMVEITR